MEEKVKYMIKLIEEDGDSFAKRAEMYYKKRPELLHFVEESYRAFRALAERYDHLSNDLQKANHTIATVFPEQVQFAMDEDDECDSLKFPRNSQVPTVNTENVPNAPRVPIKELRGPIRAASKQFPAKKLSKNGSTCKNVVKFGLNKSEALEEIDKLQKEILALQTFKEFVKSSYEIGLQKYWGIENQIMEMQQKVCSLQDEFGVDTIIEDDEARALMAEAALKSCQETLDQLKEKQEKSTADAKEEYTKIEAIGQRLKSLKREYIPDGTDVEKLIENDKSTKLAEDSKSSTEEVDGTVVERPELAVKEKKNENLEAGSMESLTVTELVEKIDELAKKVMNLETEVSSQTVLINMLRTEVDDFQAQIQILEHENETQVVGTHNLSSRVKEMERKLHMIQDLNKNVEKQNRNLQTNFTEARSSLDHLSEKLTRVKFDEEIEVVNVLQGEERTVVEFKSLEGLSTIKTNNTENVREDDIIEQIPEEPVYNQQGEGEETAEESNVVLDSKPLKHVSLERIDRMENGLLSTEPRRDTEKENALDWQQQLLSGMGDREKVLLTEYTTILRNYKEVKRKLNEIEKKDLESQFEMTVHVRELKDAVAKRDEEIQLLHQRLNHLQGTFSENKDLKEDSSPIFHNLENRAIKSEASTEVLEVHENLISAREDDIKFVLIDQAPAISAVEEKLRMDIDAILDENLDFWLRFSTAFHLIQKFQAQVQDLQNEISKIKEKKRDTGSITMDLKSEARPIYKHLREIQTELTIWLEQSVSLNKELKRRLESLCSIQEQITIALKEGVAEDEIKFSSHQAAKFQGEVLNMKQENNKVREELQAGVDHVNALQLEIEKTLRKLNEEFEMSGNQVQPQLSHSETRTRIPLRAFIFGTKHKKDKHSIFSSMLLNRRHQVSRDGGPL